MLDHRLSQDPWGHQVFTESLAALRQLASLGVERSAGQSVRYVIRDAASRSFRDRVTVAERLEEDDTLRPESLPRAPRPGRRDAPRPARGPGTEDLTQRWGLGRPVPRSRYRSPERTGQSLLDGAGPGSPGPRRAADGRNELTTREASPAP